MYSEIKNNTMAKELTPADLIRMVTDELVNGDTDAKIIYDHSRKAKELVKKGEAVISRIGNYLKDLDKTLGDYEIEGVERVQQGWILLLYDLNKKKLPEMNMSIQIIHFQKWVDWSSNYNILEKQ